MIENLLFIKVKVLKDLSEYIESGILGIKLLHNPRASRFCNFPIDLGIDVTSELNQLETELLLDAGGSMPMVPTRGEMPQYISDVDLDLEADEATSKAKLEEEIEKLRKELE